MNNQLIERLGRKRLTNELMRAGLEVAQPLHDRDIDLIAYAALDMKVDAFVARPIQMKAASLRSFGLNKKYAKYHGLLIAYVWNLNSEDEAETLALSYEEALRVVEEMRYAQSPSWKKGDYVNTQPGEKLLGLLEPYRMTPERWWERVVEES